MRRWSVREFHGLRDLRAEQALGRLTLQGDEQDAGRIDSLDASSFGGYRTEINDVRQYYERRSPGGR